jgi:hypothetical protein
MPKTADFIEETKSLKTESASKKRKVHPNSLKNLAPYPKGVSGNPGGKPKYDVAAEIARAVIEGNKEAAYKGLATALCKGNAYVFKELAERGYGKLKESREVTHIHQDLSDKELDEQIASIIAKLGLAAQIDALEPVKGERAPNGHAKDTDVLSR